MKKPNNIIVLGNGESRLQLNPVLPELKKQYITIGCNAIYRDFAPDILLATDIHIAAEIVQSGYSKKNQCYFRDWILIESELKDAILMGCDPSATITDLHTNEPFIVVNGHTAISDDLATGSNEFVVLGVDSDDLAKDVRELGCDSYNGFRFEFVGPNAIEAAAKTKGCEKVYMLGFDFASNSDGTVNNLYKGTINYLMVGAKENTKMQQNIAEMSYVFNKHPHVKFVRVSDLSYPLEWSGSISNITQISIQQFLKETQNIK